MDQPVSERLKGLGLDVEFLAWLEGEEQVLPELSRIRNVKDADLVAAIRAAGWIAQFFMDEKVISPQTSEHWLARYELLEKYLQGAIQSTLFYHAMSTAEDLSALEEVLERLLPRSYWEEYRNDILHLRRQVRIPGQGEKDSGVNVKTIPG
ncbi:MAG: hypothetical protein LAP40_27265 [Acidobacteriia bacterium]|nr:hypothetical protein [Terriglobia bacterium]